MHTVRENFYIRAEHCSLVGEVPPRSSHVSFLDDREASEFSLAE